MIRNPTIQEFEAAVTTRMLTHKRANKVSYSHSEASTLATIGANSYLQDIEANDKLWCMARGRRTYIFHVPSRRIAGELGLVFDRAADGQCKNLQIMVLDRKGLTKCKTINDLVTDLEQRQKFYRNKRKERR